MLDDRMSLKTEMRTAMAENGRRSNYSPLPPLSLDLQGREWMDISAIIGDRFFSVYFMTKYPFVCTQDSRAI